MPRVPKQVVARTVFTLNEKNKQWYWHTKALNNEVIADGAEGYNHLEDAISGFFKSQGVEYDKDHWPDGYVFMELSDKFLQINKLTK
jgi:uncharacterized protein YegP (UPF0339 family)